MARLDGLSERIAGALSAALGGEVTVSRVKPLTGGACQENFRVDIELDGAAQTFCLRSDARTALPASIKRRAEFAVINAAVGVGVPTPRARWLSPDLVRKGADAYFLDWVDGEAIGSRVTKHPKLAGAREVLPRQLAEALAAVHRITPETHPDLPITRPPFGPSVDSAEATLAFVTGMLDELPAPRPASELILRWLRANTPPTGERVLAHADYRTGNFMVGPEGLRAVLDWEFTHWSDPCEDIGWLCTRDWRFARPDLPAGGLCGRETFIRLYEAASGRTIDRKTLRWWEVCGNARWGIAAAFQGKRFTEGEPDFELLAIPRRAAEMEYEALRLIEIAEREG